MSGGITGTIPVGHAVPNASTAAPAPNASAIAEPVSLIVEGACDQRSRSQNGVHGNNGSRELARGVQRTRDQSASRRGRRDGCRKDCRRLNTSASSALPTVGERDHFTGSSSPKLTLVEYGD